MDDEREHEVAGGERVTVVPGDVPAEAICGLHGAVGALDPGAVGGRGQLGGELRPDLPLVVVLGEVVLHRVAHAGRPDATPFH